MNAGIPALAMQLCRNCGHAIHHHDEGRWQCRFCQTSPQTPCSCQHFQFPDKRKVCALPLEEQLKLACAAHLGLHPISIHKVEEVRHHRELIGLNVTVYIFTGDGLTEWIRDHLPKDEDWVLKYIAELERQKK